MILIILLDDVGFAASSAFGGPISTPTAERLAAGGLKYTRLPREWIDKYKLQSVAAGGEAL